MRHKLSQVASHGRVLTYLQRALFLKYNDMLAKIFSSERDHVVKKKFPKEFFISAFEVIAEHPKVC